MNNEKDRSAQISHKSETSTSKLSNNKVILIIITKTKTGYRQNQEKDSMLEDQTSITQFGNQSIDIMNAKVFILFFQSYLELSTRIKQIRKTKEETVQKNQFTSNPKRSILFLSSPAPVTVSGSCSLQRAAPSFLADTALALRLRLLRRFSFSTS